MERSLPAKDKEKKLGKLPRALGSVLKAMHPDAAQQAYPSAAQPSAPALALPAEIEATQATLAQLRIGDLEADLCLGLSQASSTTPAPLESPALPPAPTPVLLEMKSASGDVHGGGDVNSGDGASGDAHSGPHGGGDDGEGYDGTFDYYEDDGGETSFFLLGEEVIDYDSPIWD
mmetsp:Transcript_38483/g.66767  ORF Transcript_38483/g.66767 Transcript_38483/m.66767 type:complete len:174 (-) Transcript_38483:82-603(-)